MFYALISIAKEDIPQVVVSSIVLIAVIACFVARIIWLPYTKEEVAEGILGAIKWIFIIIFVIACPPIGIIYLINRDDK